METSIFVNENCVQIAAGIPVDIMPGTNDPANFSLPQQVSVVLITF